MVLIVLLCSVRLFLSIRFFFANIFLCSVFLYDPSLYTVQNGGSYVIVTSSVTVKTYLGAMTFTTTSRSRNYVNRDVEHVTSMRKRFSALSPKVVAIEGPSVVKLPPEYSYM